MAEFLKPRTLKDHIKAVQKMRSADDAIQEMIDAFDNVIIKVIAEAAKEAKTSRRTTILKEDAAAALEKHLKNKNLTWDETAREVIRQTPADLGKISKAIQDYIASGGKTVRANPKGREWSPRRPSWK